MRIVPIVLALLAVVSAAANRMADTSAASSNAATSSAYASNAAVPGIYYGSNAASPYLPEENAAPGPPPQAPVPPPQYPAQLAATAQSWVGQPLPEWTIAPEQWMNTSEPIAWNTWQGRYTFIEFIRILCPHCRKAAPERIRLYKRFHARGLAMIDIQSPGTAPEESDWRQVKETLREWGLPYPVGFDRDAAIRNQYGLGLYPTVLVLDRQGIVRFAQTGYTAKNAAELEAFLEARLPRRRHQHTS